MTAFWILQGTCLMILVICFLGLLRTWWVFDKRSLYVLTHSYSEYQKLWSYEKMMNYFWIWDIEKMKTHTTEASE